jgi:hypothetical protein
MNIYEYPKNKAQLLTLDEIDFVGLTEMLMILLWSNLCKLATAALLSPLVP